MKLIFFILMVVFLGGSFIAKNVCADSSRPPDGVAAHHILPLLEALNSGDAKQIESFIKQSFASEFLNQFPMDVHVEYLLETHALNGELTFHSMRRFDDPRPENEQVIVVKSTRTELWNALAIYVTAEKPHKINGLGMWSERSPESSASLTLVEAIAELDSYAKRMAKKDVFSGSVLIAKGDNVLYKAAFGMASKRFNAPNNVQTKFNLASMNKMFTSVAIMQLVEAGKLSLSDKLSKFADESWLPKDISEKIEIRHLLTHSSGLGSYFNQTYMETSKNRYRALDDYKPLIRDEKLQFDPGTDTSYSNTGMFMLGVVIEKVSGQNYFSYIRDHIYAPAGMIHSDSFEMDQPVPNLAIGYKPNRDNETGWTNNLYTHVLKGGPAGGGFSTVEDLHRFSLELTQFKLLSKKFTEELYSPKPELHSLEYGYGFALDGTAEDRIVGHGGGFDGISTNLDIYLDRGYIAVVLSNYSNGSRPIESKVRELLELVE